MNLTNNEKFNNKILIDLESNCWNWTGSHHKEKPGFLPYGLFSFQRKNYLAHRFSYMINKGEIPKGLCVLHKCDNPKCVNPEHLSLGTHMDNTIDKMNKGRQCKGETHGQCKLRDMDIEIIKLGNITQLALANIFGVSQAHISRIKLNQRRAIR